MSSLHSDGQGWLWFRHPQDLGFKASSGMIDLDVEPNGFTATGEELVTTVARLPLPAGFEVATHSSKRRNVVLRHACPRFMTDSGVPDHTDELDRALDACRRITAWFDEGGAGLLRGDGDE